MNKNASIRVPFDESNAGKYELKVVPNPSPDGDVVRLYVSPEACKSFAEIFQQLAENPGIGHVHLGTTEFEMGPGFTLFVDETGRGA